MFWKKKKKPKLTGRDAALAQAKAVAAEKREEIGDETLDKIREAMMRRENSPMAKAVKQVQAMDKDKVHDNITLLLRDKE